MFALKLFFILPNYFNKRPSTCTNGNLIVYAFYLTVNVCVRSSNFRNAKWNGVKNVFPYQPICMLVPKTLSYLMMIIRTNRKCWKLQRKRHKNTPPSFLNVGFYSIHTEISSSFDIVLPNMPISYTSFWTEFLIIIFSILCHS